MKELKPGIKVGIGHSDLCCYILRRPTKEEFPGMLKEYVKKLDENAACYIKIDTSWVIRIPMQEEWPKETISIEEEAVLW